MHPKQQKTITFFIISDSFFIKKKKNKLTFKISKIMLNFNFDKYEKN